MSISELRKRIEKTGEKKAISLNLGKIGELILLVLIGFFGANIEALPLSIFLCIIFLLIQLRKVVTNHIEKNKRLETVINEEK